MAVMLAANVAGVAFAGLAPFPELSAPRAVTQGPHDHFLANYFAINAWSPDNRHLLTLETDLKDELPDGRPCTLGLVDLADGNRFIPVMETRAWNFQEAAMAHWLPNEKDTFVVNDFRDGKFVAVVRNWRTGAERVIPHPVSAVSEDGTWALSINYARLYLTRPDYGYAGEGQDPRRGIVFPEDDGLWRVDLTTGEAKLLVSCAALRDKVPHVPETGLSYICHTVISKDMKRVYFLSRSVSQSMEGVKKFTGVNWHTTAFTCNADGSDVRRCFPDGWGSSHFNWKPAHSERDARTMIVTCNWQNRVYTHVEFTVGEEDKAHQVGGDAMNFDGHCIYTPDGNFISGDGYWDDNFYRHWKMVRLADNAVKDIGDFYVPAAYRDVYCRCDLHPRWRPDGRPLAFNSVHEGSRQIYVMDVVTNVPAKCSASWFQEARFGMFIHWGLYSVPARGEWIYARHPWKRGEFEALAKTWNPTNYNPREWARLAKRAGMKYGVLTTRHHDGFAMFDSHFADFKITNTPYGKDAVREYVEAFRAEGLKVGFYHSLPDWRHPGYSDPESPDGIQGRPLHNPTPEEHAAFQELVRNHVRQLLTEYGKIDLLFLDYTSKYKQEGDYFDREKILKIAYECQPDIIVNDRLSFWKDNVRDFDYYTPEVCIPSEPLRVKGREVAWETCATINGSWGYRADDNAWKTPEALVAGLVGCVSRNGNLLLNVGPMADGSLPAPAVERLNALGDWHDASGESIFGCGKSDFTPPFGCAYTQKGNSLYCHFLQPPLGDVILPGLKGKVAKATLLRTGEVVECVDNWGFELLKPDDQRIRPKGVRAGDVVRIELSKQGQ